MLPLGEPVLVMAELLQQRPHLLRDRLQGGVGRHRDADAVHLLIKVEQQRGIHHLLLGRLEPEIIGLDKASSSGRRALDRGIGVQPEDMDDTVLGPSIGAWGPVLERMRNSSP
jgi:hypothetical protein